MNEIQGQLPILTGKKGRYQLIRPLGNGSFGEIFLAKDLDHYFNNPDLVVVKRLRTSNHSPKDVPAIKRAFEEEARFLHEHKNDNIPSLYDYFSLTGTDPQLHTPQEFYYLVEQYIEGEDLEKELEQQGRFSEEKVLALLNNI